MEPELLITVNSNYHIGIIQNVLEENGIHCHVQDRNVGGYMRLYAGNSIFGTDIYVSPDNMEKAKELLKELNLDENPQLPDEDELAREALEAGIEED